jgi:hypothetical protein
LSGLSVMKTSLSQPSLVPYEADRQSRLTFLGQNRAATAIALRELPVAALPPDMRSAERAKPVLAFKSPGGGHGLAAGVRPETNVRGQEAAI